MPKADARRTGQRRWMRYFDAQTVTQLSHIGIRPSVLVEGNLVGNHRSPFHGFAIEFAGHRQYVPGDDIRHLDWRAHFRTGKYYVKQYEEDTNFNAHLVVDVSRTMLFEHRHGKKMDYAAFIAVALSQIVINQSDAVGAHFFDETLRETVAVSSSEDVVRTLSGLLEATEPKGASSIGDVLCLLAEQIRRRQVVFVISDLLSDPEDTFRGVKRLLDDRHEVILVHILDPLEIDFDVPGRVRLVELEGGRTLNLVGHDIRESYREVFGAYLEALDRGALRLGVDYLRCSMDRSFGLHLAEYLSRRQLR